MAAKVWARGAYLFATGAFFWARTGNCFSASFLSIWAKWISLTPFTSSLYYFFYWVAAGLVSGFFSTGFTSAFFTSGLTSAFFSTSLVSTYFTSYLTSTFFSTLTSAFFSTLTSVFFSASTSVKLWSLLWCFLWWLCFLWCLWCDLFLACSSAFYFSASSFSIILIT